MMDPEKNYHYFWLAPEGTQVPKTAKIRSICDQPEPTQRTALQAKSERQLMQLAEAKDYVRSDLVTVTADGQQIETPEFTGQELIQLLAAKKKLQSTKPIKVIFYPALDVVLPTRPDIVITCRSKSPRTKNQEV